MQVATGITLIDTLLGGNSGITSAYLVAGTAPALVDTGAQTSAVAVESALQDLGMGSDDLAWLVLTHIHLDHCGAVGDLAAAFPKATVVVHRRGARHLAAPERLVQASAAVYGDTAPMYGGLTALPEERIVAVEDGFEVNVGGSRRLVMMEALGHARHHMAVLDEATGTVMAGDALGVQFTGAGLYQALPPPDVDIERSLATLDRLARLEPDVLLLGHFGPVPDPAMAIAVAADQQRALGEATLTAWREGGAPAATEAAATAVSITNAVGDNRAVTRWQELGWDANTVLGLVDWAERTEAAATSAGDERPESRG
jgi:glyoxylase-like metal-dependent hydrolase (beta-lactamase superfamily II)